MCGYIGQASICHLLPEKNNIAGVGILTSMVATGRQIPFLNIPIRIICFVEVNNQNRHNMIKKLILGISVVAALWGCDSKERAKLQTEVDSLRVELQVSQQLTKNMEEIGILLDSIDANRQLLRTDMVEWFYTGDTREDFST
jgi:hypothetical protein